MACKTYRDWGWGNRLSPKTSLLCLFVRSELQGVKSGMDGNMGRSGDGEVEGGGVGNFIATTYSLHGHHLNDFALRWAAV